MIPDPGSRDQIRRPGVVRWTRPVTPTVTPSITRSVWPPLTRSDRPPLDTLPAGTHTRVQIPFCTEFSRGCRMT